MVSICFYMVHLIPDHGHPCDQCQNSARTKVHSGTHAQRRHGDQYVANFLHLNPFITYFAFYLCILSCYPIGRVLSEKSVWSLPSLSWPQSSPSSSTTSSKASLVVSHQCDVWRKDYRIKGDIGKHVGAVHERGSDHCDVWRKNYRNSGDLGEYMGAVHEGGFDHCDVCKKDSEIKRTLENI